MHAFTGGIRWTVSTSGSASTYWGSAVAFSGGAIKPFSSEFWSVDPSSGVIISSDYVSGFQTQPLSASSVEFQALAWERCRPSSRLSFVSSVSRYYPGGLCLRSQQSISGIVTGGVSPVIILSADERGILTVNSSHGSFDHSGLSEGVITYHAFDSAGFCASIHAASCRTCIRSSTPPTWAKSRPARS